MVVLSRLATAGLLLLSLALAIIAFNVSWATSEGTDITMRGMETDFGSEGSTVLIEYGSAFDEENGIKHIRAGAGLWLAGMIVAGIAMLVIENGLVLRLAWVNGLATLLTIVAGILVVLGVVFFPLGIDAMLEAAPGSEPPPMSWGPGLYLGILAGLLAAGAAIQATASWVGSEDANAIMEEYARAARRAKAN